ncbi:MULTISPECIES: glycosyltransferase family 4 protein [Haloarcula]|uniref:glycosyltransferase family 4 protein n=1 Tax=Haloarcula TaxID=2237 RepID=UPI0023ED128E|nr:glycosyltransferase [Halomicroarcula sp. XH51]
MSKRICLFVGSATAFNVRQTLQGIGQALESTVDLDLVTTSEELTTDLASLYDVYGTGQPASLQGRVRALETYLTTHRPACMMNVSRPPIQGNITGVLARWHGVPFIYRYSGDRFHVHRLATTLGRQAKWYALNNIVGYVPLRLASHYVALGPVGKRRLENQGVPSKAITILPPPVDPERFSPTGPVANLDHPPNRKVVLFVGRRSRLKGIDTIEQVIPEILGRRSDLQFVFVGGGRDLDTSVANCDHVTVVGPVPPAEMPSYYRAADVLIHPSLTESFGRVLVEALLCGTPVVARRAGELPSITSNLISTPEELIDTLCQLEELTVDNPARFTPEELKPRYAEFFERF